MSSRSSVCLLFAAVGLLVTGCGPKPIVVPPSGAHLRGTFGGDPAGKIGLFIPSDTLRDAVREETARQTKCTPFITARPPVTEGTSTFDQSFAATSKAAAKWGVPVIASAAGAIRRGEAVRVRYTQTATMGSDTDDRLSQCCAAHPDACDGRYISGFLRGAGSIFKVVDTDIDAGGTLRKGSQNIDVDIAHGARWEETRTFDDAYFAFTLQAAPQSKAGTCAWIDHTPPHLSRQYFVRGSAPSPNKVAARAAVRAALQVAVAEHLATAVRAESNGALDLQTGQLVGQSQWRATADAAFTGLVIESWCAGPERPDGAVVEHALAYVPLAELARARQALIEAHTDHQTRQECERLRVAKGERPCDPPGITACARGAWHCIGGAAAPTCEVVQTTQCGPCQTCRAGECVDLSPEPPAYATATVTITPSISQTFRERVPGQESVTRNFTTPRCGDCPREVDARLNIVEFTASPGFVLVGTPRQLSCSGGNLRCNAFLRYGAATLDSGGYTGRWQVFSRSEPARLVLAWDQLRTASRVVSGPTDTKRLGATAERLTLEGGPHGGRALMTWDDGEPCQLALGESDDCGRVIFEGTAPAAPGGNLRYVYRVVRPQPACAP